MEVGDVDMDGIDELAMTVNVNDLKEKNMAIIPIMRNPI